MLAHGAGAGMRHPFMEHVAERLFQEGVATLRYEFPYMAAGRTFPDRPGTLVQAVRRALERSRMAAPDLPLFAGGKSLGGRMTSTAATDGALMPEDGGEEGVRGLVFLGFPLHPPKKPGTERAEHLARVDLPMLFVQGDRDRLAPLDLLEPVVEGLGGRGTLHVVRGGDHGFDVLKRSGRTAAEVMDEIGTAVAEWIRGRLAATSL